MHKIIRNKYNIFTKEDFIASAIGVTIVAGFILLFLVFSNKAKATYDWQEINPCLYEAVEYECPTITPEVTQEATPSATVTPETTPGPGNIPENPSDGRSDGLSSCPSCTAAPKAEVLGLMGPPATGKGGDK